MGTQLVAVDSKNNIVQVVIDLWKDGFHLEMEKILNAISRNRF